MSVRWSRLGPLDRVLWLRYCSAFGFNPEQFLYDRLVGVGSHGPQPDQNGIPPAYRELLRKRLDVFLALPDAWSFWEVKPLAGAQALGQILVYRSLLSREANSPPLIRAGCVCEAVDHDAVPLFAQHDISLYVLPASAPSEQG